MTSYSTENDIKHDISIATLESMLVKELGEFGKNGTLSKASLDNIDKLAHATKNVIKVIECCEEEKYSNAMGRYAREDRSYADRNSYGDGYSRANDSLRNQLYKMMDTAPDERTRESLHRFINTL